MAHSDMSTPEGRARERAKNLSNLVWHTAAFVVVNTFLWIQDIAAGGGLEYAYWTTIGWGIGLAFHYLAYFVGRRNVEGRKYEQFLAEERQRDLQAH